MQRTVVTILAAALLVGCGGDPSPEMDEGVVPALHPSVDGYGETVLSVDGIDLPVLVADEPGERRHGLMEVEALPPGIGMLFVYEEDHEGGFWMKNTLVPLSIAFVAADGRIVEILEMEPCPSGAECPSYRPETPYRYAVEVTVGWYDDNDIVVGDRFQGLPGSPG